MSEKTLSFAVVARDLASHTFEKVGHSVQHLGQETDSSSGKASKFSKVGQAAGRGLAVGFGVAVAAGIKMTHVAEQNQASQSKLAGIMKNAAGATGEQVKSTEEWVDAQGRAKGVSDEELRPALGRLIAVTHNVGKSQKLAGLAMNISAGTGKDLTSVSTALAKAQAGSLGGLSRLGVATKNAAGQTKSLASIQKDLATTYAGASARAANTAAGKQKILEEREHQLQERIGGGLLPVVEKLTDAGLKLTDWVSNHTKLTGILIGSVAGLFAILKLVSLGTQIYEASTKIAAVASKVWAGAQWLLNAALDANPIGLIIVAVAALVAIIVIAYKHSETFRRIVSAAWQGIKNVIGAVVGWFRSWVPAVFHFVVAAVTRYVQIYRAVVTAVFHAVANVIGAVLGFIRRIVSTVWGFISAYVRTEVNIIRAVVTTVWHAISTVISSVVNFIKRVVSTGFNVIRSGISAAMNTAKSIVSGAWNFLKTAFSHGIDAIIALARNIGGRIKSALGNLGSLLWNAGRAVIQGLINGITSMFGSLLAKAKSIASTIAKTIKGALHIGSPSRVMHEMGTYVVDGLVNGMDSRIGSLSRAASRLAGAASFGAAGPTVAGGVSTPSTALSSGGGAISGQPVVVQLVLDGRVVQQSLLKVKRGNGGLALGLA